MDATTTPPKADESDTATKPLAGLQRERDAAVAEADALRKRCAALEAEAASAPKITLGGVPGDVLQTHVF